MKKILPLIPVLFLSVFIYTGMSAQILSVDLGNDTTLCRGAVIVLDAGIIQGIDINYEWNGNPELKDRYFNVSLGGKYWVKITSPQLPGMEAIDTITIIDVENPQFEILHAVMDYFCKGDQVELAPSVTQADWVYEWEYDKNILITTNTIADTTGEYKLTVTDKNNCVTVKSVNLEFQYPWEEDKILLATYDPEEKKNIVIWKKTNEKRTESYILFRGTDPENDFGMVPFQEVNLVVDFEWDPNAGPAQYNCILMDVCQNYSAVKPEWIHQTIHLSVEITPEKENKLTWTSYKGFDFPSFDILRGTLPENLEVIKTIEHSKEEIYTYIDAVGEGNYYYQVRINTPEVIYLTTEPGKKAGAGPFVHSFSNLEDNQHSTGKNILNIIPEITVFPNPFSGNTNVRYYLDQPGNVTMEILNLLGQRVAILYNGMQNEGIHNITFSVKEYGQQPGVYFLRYNVNGKKTITTKIIEKQ